MSKYFSSSVMCRIQSATSVFCVVMVRHHLEPTRTARVGKWEPKHACLLCWLTKWWDQIVVSGRGSLSLVDPSKLARVKQTKGAPWVQCIYLHLRSRVWIPTEHNICALLFTVWLVTIIQYLLLNWGTNRGGQNWPILNMFLTSPYLTSQKQQLFI